MGRRNVTTRIVRPMEKFLLCLFLNPLNFWVFIPPLVSLNHFRRARPFTFHTKSSFPSIYNFKYFFRNFIIKTFFCRSSKSREFILLFCSNIHGSINSRNFDPRASNVNNKLRRRLPLCHPENKKTYNYYYYSSDGSEKGFLISIIYVHTYRPLTVCLYFFSHLRAGQASETSTNTKSIPHATKFKN